MATNTNILVEPTKKYLELSDGRTLAYTDSGNPQGALLVIFFHGVFGVGRAPELQRVLKEKDVHYIAPTLPGWGLSSPRNKVVSCDKTLASDITQLINHLHPEESNIKIYVAGGSYGTVHAQMLYGAPFDIFPYGANIVGCLLLAPFSPFKYHEGYAKTMTTPNYISVGPPSQLLPFKIVPRITAAVMKTKLSTVDKAEVFVRETLFDNMGEEEKLAFQKFKEETNKKDGELERTFAENVFKSVQKTWDGFFEVSDVIHSDWGFAPDCLDEEHNRRPILIVGSSEDKLAPDSMANWLAGKYKNGHLRLITGGHLAALFHLDDIWKQLFEL